MEGLEKFREAFEAYSENYVIIGGTACDIAMTGTAVRPRATHDIDMIVVVEKMTDSFDEIWPSHSDIPLSPDCIRRLHDGAVKILNGEAEGKPTEFFGQQITVYNLGFTTFLCNK